MQFLNIHSDILIYIIIAAGLLFITYLIFSLYSQGTTKIQLAATNDALLKASEEKETHIMQLKQSLNDTASRLRECEHGSIVLKQDNKNLSMRLAELRSDFENKEKEHRDLLKKYNDSLLKIASLEGQVDALELLAEENERRHVTQSRELEARLKAISEDIVQKRGADLHIMSLNSMSKAIEPLKEELGIFRNLIGQTQKISSEQSGALKQELLRLNEAQHNLKLKADDLINALKSGGKSQGMWGEHQLELVLESSGLREGFEYRREVAGNRALKEMGRADVLICLPDSKNIVIDAKCSLTAYTDFVNAKDKETSNRALSLHCNSVKAHIDELASARYDEYASFNSPSFIFMFIPIDGALSCALESKSDLYGYAAGKNIYLVSPQTLLPALRVVSNLWILATQNEKVQEIVKNAMAIYKKSLLVKEAFIDTQKKLEQLNSSFSLGLNRLSEGRGSLCQQLESFSNTAPVSSDRDIIDIESMHKSIPETNEDEREL